MMNINKIVSDFNVKQLISSKDEVSLFRLLANIIIDNSNSVYIEELHGHKGQVEFQSQLFPDTTSQCEICDLMIVCHDTNSRETRVTFHQNKYQRNTGVQRIQPTFKFKGDIHQYDLLSSQQDVNSLGSVVLPSKILESEYNSIGSYGVFYTSRSHLIDYQYCIAKWITPQSFVRHPNLIINHCLNNRSSNGMELISTNGLYNFLRALQLMQIGSPVVTGTDLYKFLGSIQNKINNPTILDIFDTDELAYEGDVRLLVIHTNTEEHDQ